jgi:hypothetical protein
MRERADKTLKYFFEVMPDIPFGTDDIIFDFAPPSKMAARYKALCAEYRPREIILEEHEEQLADGTGGQAIIGEGKSVVLICTKQPYLNANLRRIIFHELTHIYCAKTETDGEHFVDIYESGKPYDEKSEDLCDGYFIWSEFIADYISHEKTINGKSVFEYGCRGDVIRCLDAVVIGEDSRRDFEWACLNILNASEPEKIISRICEPDYLLSGIGEYADNARKYLYDCLQLLYKQIQKPKPWKIEKDFILQFGKLYTLFKNYNTMYRLKQSGVTEETLRAFLQHSQADKNLEA